MRVTCRRYRKEWMDIIDFIKPELLIVAVVLYFVELALKKSKIVNSKYISLISGGIGILICTLYVFASCPMEDGKNIAMAAFTAITQGIVVAGIAIYIPKMIEKVKDKKDSDEENDKKEK